MTPAELDLLDRASGFARDVIAPAAAQWERERAAPAGAFRQAANCGLTTLLLPQAQGGHGVTTVAAARIYEELSKAGFAFTFGLLVHNNVLRALGECAGAEIRDVHVRQMAEGSSLGAFCLTEPNAGSDAAAIECLARRVAGGWCIDGEKAWVTNGRIATLLMVFAQTDRAKGWRGIASYLVPTSAEGVERLPLYDLPGGHAMGTAGFRFSDCQIDDGNMLAAPGDGFKMAMGGIDRARLFIAAMCCGMLSAALDVALDRLKRRSAFGRPLAAFQGLQWMAADIGTELRASRALVFDVARRFDAGRAVSADAAHAKKFAARTALNSISACLQLMGAAGLLVDGGLGRHLVEARIAQYLDGTPEVQNIVIGRQLFGVASH